MADSGEYDIATIQRRQKIAEQMLAEASKPQKIEHWAQGLSYLGNVGADAYALNRLDRLEREGQQATRGAYSKLLGEPSATAAPVASPSAVPAVAHADDDLGSRISGIESGGKYDALGPIIPKTGDRAYGKYQVMGANVPEWTKAHLGRSMTPQEFVANPDAQEAVFKGQFGNYVKKYGPEGASRAWFAGENGMNDMGRRDPLGTSVADYSRKFMGGAPPPPRAAVAQAMAPPAPGGPWDPSMPSGAEVSTVPAMAPGAPPTDVSAQSKPAGAAIAQAMTPTPAAQPSAVAPAPPADARSKIVAMLNDKNPYVQRVGQQLAQQYIQKNLVGAEDTNDIKEQNRINAERRAAGQPPIGLLDYQTKLKEAGKPVTNINQQQESEFQKGAGKFYSERYGEMVKGASDAGDMMADIGNIRDLGSRITTGKTAEIQAALGPYAEALGVKIEGLGDLQAYEAITAKLAPRMRVAGSGATSDFEMKNFLKSLPGIGKTPQGNEIIANTLQAIQEHKIAAGEIANRALAGDISRTEAEKQIKGLGDPLALWKKNKGKLPTDTATAPGVDDLLKKYGPK